MTVPPVSGTRDDLGTRLQQERPSRMAQGDKQEELRNTGYTRAALIAIRVADGLKGSLQSLIDIHEVSNFQTLFLLRSVIAASPPMVLSINVAG
ncbi:hypothetical protein NliqN6_3973 [Naganishia liquefaciens]|uniref:Uncharacterized protein n=1 Tax=Naganishia liquefaciens TaxID=104408 RepID=A0A8H3TU37_9TREE|nr:hypothetical protein NliqN6_3973 [Naganishia liquefaciens]